MDKKVAASMIGSGVIAAVVTSVSAVFGFFGLLLALNGFMGQERAVNTSIAAYLIMAVLVMLGATLLSILVSRHMLLRLGWGVPAALLLPAVSFAVIGVLLHILSIVVAAIIAGQLRTR